MKHAEIIDLADAIRTLVGECELTGRKTAFDRNGRPVAVLVSWDEYLALRETIAIAKEPALLASIRKSDAEAGREAFAEIDERAERIRLPRSLATRAQNDAVRAAMSRISDDPIAGAPLFEPLRGLWTYRNGALRIVYRIVPDARYVLILAIGEGDDIDAAPTEPSAP